MLNYLVKLQLFSNYQPSVEAFISSSKAKRNKKKQNKREELAAFQHETDVGEFVSFPVTVSHLYLHINWS